MRSEARVLLLGVLAASALGCAGTAGALGPSGASGVCPGAGGAPWREVRSEHFRLETDLEPAQADAAVIELEKDRQALLRTWSSTYDPPGQVEAILYRDWSGFARFKNEQVLGFMSRVGPTPLLVMAQGAPEGAMAAGSVQVHELTHYLSYFFLARQPRWLAEGLASYYSTLKLQRGDSEALLGLPPAVLLARLHNQGFVAPENLWSWSGVPVEDLYASSWLLVHYLIHREPERLADFERRLASVADSRRAWDEAFEGLSDSLLVQELVRYLGQPLPAYGLKLPPAPAPKLEQRLLSDADFHAFQARIWVTGYSRATFQERLWYAHNELGEALRLEPEHAGARQLEIELTPDPRVRAALARSLAALHPESGRTWAALADALRILRDPGSERTEAAARALARAPGDPQTLDIVALEYVEKGRAAEALPLTAEAVRLAPWSVQRLEVHAAVLAELGRCAEAAAAERRALDILPESAPAKERDASVGRLFQYERQCPPRAEDSGPADRLK